MLARPHRYRLGARPLVPRREMDRARNCPPASASTRASARSERVGHRRGPQRELRRERRETVRHSRRNLRARRRVVRSRANRVWVVTFSFVPWWQVARGRDCPYAAQVEGAAGGHDVPDVLIARPFARAAVARAPLSNAHALKTEGDAFHRGAGAGRIAVKPPLDVDAAIRRDDRRRSGAVRRRALRVETESRPRAALYSCTTVAP